MTKQEKIKEAFGKSWNLLTHSMQQHILNVHHWVDRSRNRMNLSPRDLGFDEETECEVHCEFWRPIQLKGLENNNGWIKIDRDNDLPGYYDKESIFEVGFLTKTGFHQKQKGYTAIAIKRFWNKKLITHYKPVEKSNPPIY